MITCSAPVLALLEALLQALFLANVAGDGHDVQAGGTFGFIHQALTHALTQEFGDEVALRLYEEMIDNMESIAYNIDLYNRGLI